MSFLAALWILVHALLAGAFGPTPAPHGVTVPPAAPAPAAVERTSAPHPRGDAPRKLVPPAPVVTTPQAPTAPITVAAPPSTAAAPSTPPWEMCPEHPQMSDDPWIVANCPPAS